MKKKFCFIPIIFFLLLHVHLSAQEQKNNTAPKPKPAVNDSATLPKFICTDGDILFKPQLAKPDPFTYSFDIFDRWGTLVYETDDPKAGWDGTSHGKRVNDNETYYYLVSFRYPWETSDHRLTGFATTQTCEE